MELIYIYIDKYRNYKETELSLGDRFNIEYDKYSNNLSIERNNKKPKKAKRSSNIIEAEEVS